MKALEIALICTEKLPVPAVAGGAIQIYIDGILPYLSKHHNITVFSTSYPGFPSDEMKNNIHYIRISPINTRYYINTIKSRLDNSFDLVHIFNRPLWLLSISESFPNLNLSLSLHNDMFYPDKMTKSEVCDCINKLKFITTVSKYIANEAEKACPQAKGKINVVYSGVDADIYKPPNCDEDRLKKNKLKKDYGFHENKIVLFVGRLNPDKGIHVLISAMEQIMNQRSDTALIIVGSKWFGENKVDTYTKLIESLSRKLKGQVDFTGFLAPSEISAYYNMADIFVCPSQWNEPLARVLYEAMAAGLPIVTTNRGGNAEVISNFHNGIVIDDFNNHQCLAQAISLLLNNPYEAVEMGKTGRSLAISIYNWERVSDDIQRLISRYLL